MSILEASMINRREARKFLKNSTILCASAVARIDAPNWPPLSVAHRSWLLRLIAVLDQQSTWIRDALAGRRPLGDWPQAHESLGAWPDGLFL
jgi:hypothetical protein